MKQRSVPSVSTWADLNWRLVNGNRSKFIPARTVSRVVRRPAVRQLDYVDVAPAVVTSSGRRWSF
jgi:hypothetical protein